VTNGGPAENTRLAHTRLYRPPGGVMQINLDWAGYSMVGQVVIY
jgi:hypothetical protein